MSKGSHAVFVQAYVLLLVTHQLKNVLSSLMEWENVHKKTARTKIQRNEPVQLFTEVYSNEGSQENQTTSLPTKSCL